MGRLNAWIASRAKSRRSARVRSTNGTSVRPLGFERYEERIALSTNAAFEIVPVDKFIVDAAEGGWIQYNFADASLFASAGTTTFSAGKSEASFVIDFDYSILDRSTGLDSLWSQPTLSPDDSFGGSSPELMLTDTSIVPIPPPTAGQGGSEGGQISMTPFMGPATLGLPSAGDSLYAAKGRPALRSESLDAATDISRSTPTDSLRGRAVVYEVAHAQGGRSADRDRLATAEVSLAAYEHENGGAETHVLTHASRQQTSAAADGGETTSLPPSKTHANPDGEQRIQREDAVADPAVAAWPSTDAADANEARRPSADATAANDPAAHDAAFAQWRRELEPALESRTVAAATADSQQRRVLGAALVVLGAIPVTKALRRHPHPASVELRPRERRDRQSRNAQ